MLDKKNIKKIDWILQEDVALKSLYDSGRLKKWSLIAQHLEIEHSIYGKSGKDCRERYNSLYEQNVNRQDWTEEQEKKLFRLHDELGNKWAIISQYFGDAKTDNNVKNHFFSRLRKSLRVLNKVVQENYKKKVRQLKTKVLYKILEAAEEKFKSQPMCELQTSQHGCRLKNKILQCSYKIEKEESEGDQEIKNLIFQIVAFSRNYKRKPKKFRKMSSNGNGCQNLNAQKISVRRTISNDSVSINCKSEKSSGESDSQDDIIYREYNEPQERYYNIQRKIQQQPSEVKVQGIIYQNGNNQKNQNSQLILQELGLLEQLNAAIHPSLMKKQTSYMSQRSNDIIEADQFKFFQDSQIEMRIFCSQILPSSKKQSFEEKFFHQ